jgi:hypothetical protein
MNVTNEIVSLGSHGGLLLRRMGCLGHHSLETAAACIFANYRWLLAASLATLKASARSRIAIGVARHAFVILGPVSVFAALSSERLRL